MNQVMVDIETLGLVPGSAIISIGAVSLVRGKPVGEYESEFYTTISIESNIKEGLVFSPSTIEWWIRGDQDAAAKSALKFEHPLSGALADFWNWYKSQESGTVWGNGSSFDLVLLESAFAAVGAEPPWKFYEHRCFRTMKCEFPQVPKVVPTVANDALSDAKAQADWLQAIWRLIDSKS